MAEDKAKALEAKGKELEKRAKDLDEQVKQLNEKAKELAEKADALDVREEGLDEREKTLVAGGKKGNKAQPKEKKLSAAEEKLIAKACDKYGIKEDFVFASGIQDKDGTPEAVIVTNGGKKVRYADGDEVLPLSDVQITGVSPNKPRKVVAGKEKKDKK